MLVPTSASTRMRSCGAPGLTILGGYAPDFSRRAPWETPSILGAPPGVIPIREPNLVAGPDDHAGLGLDGLSGLLAAGVRPGDDVITPSLTFVAGAQCTLEIGARPVFCDVDPHTFTSDAACYEAVLTPKTKAIFIESIANPAGSVTDIEAISAVARNAGVPLIVDNTLATPYLIRPIDHGADIVVHSLTKFLGGHGNSIGPSSSASATRPVTGAT